jgi:hypothetical protein
MYVLPLSVSDGRGSAASARLGARRFAAGVSVLAHETSGTPLLRISSREALGVLVGRSAAQAPSEAGSRTRRSRGGEDKRT